MKSRIILLALVVAALSSCSTYKSGQTPDDVYYSPTRETEQYVRVEERQEAPRYNDYSNRNNAYDNYDDRWLRMRVRNRSRWSSFDDYDWNYMPYSYNSISYNNPYYYNSWNSYWNNYYAWNSYYNPYCPRVIVVSPKSNATVYNKVRNFNVTSYRNTNYNNSNTARKPVTRGSAYSGYNNSNSSSTQRKVNTSSGRGNNDSYYTPSSSDRPTRTYTPSSSSPSSSGSSSSGSSSSGSSSSGSSSGSSGGGSRPSRGGN